MAGRQERTHCASIELFPVVEDGVAGRSGEVNMSGFANPETMEPWR